MNRRKLATGAHHHFSVTGSHGGLQPGQPGRPGTDQAGSQTTNNHIGCTGSLRLATWNCCGLSVTQKQLCLEMDYDILGLTETHDKGALAGSSNFIPAEPAPDDDCASGVALLLSQQNGKECYASRVCRITDCVCKIPSCGEQHLRYLRVHPACKFNKP